MKVVCDNCRAVYQIPEKKLVKEVNKATCRKCGYRMLIRRPQPEPAESAAPGTEEQTVIASTDAVEQEIRAQREASPPPPREPVPKPEPPPQRQRPPKREPIPPPSRSPTPLPSPGVDHAADTEESPRPEDPSPAGSPAPSALPSPDRPSREPSPLSAREDTTPHRPRVTSAARPFDPSGDLSTVLVAGAVAFVGSFLLAASPGGLVLATIGGLLAFWGAAMVVLVLLTGQRGQKKASTGLSTVLSVFIAALFALPLAFFVHGEDVVRTGTSQGQDPVSTAPTTPSPEETTESEAVERLMDAVDESESETTDPADPTPDEDGADKPPDDPEASTTESGSDEPETTPSTSGSTSAPPPSDTTPSSGRSSSSRSSGSSRSGSGSSSSSSGSSGSASSSSSGSSRSSSGSDLPKTVPMEVINIQISTNKKVKACFVDEYRRKGSVPEQLTLKFRLDPDGKASRAWVTESEWQGSELETCLRSVITTIQFPPFDGSAYTTVYRFTL